MSGDRLCMSGRREAGEQSEDLSHVMGRRACGESVTARNVVSAVMPPGLQPPRFGRTPTLPYCSSPMESPRSFRRPGFEWPASCPLGAVHAAQLRRSRPETHLRLTGQPNMPRSVDHETRSRSAALADEGSAPAMRTEPRCGAQDRLALSKLWDRGSTERLVLLVARFTRC
jgi:hypothetical protein